MEVSATSTRGNSSNTNPVRDKKRKRNDEVTCVTVRAQKNLVLPSDDPTLSSDRDHVGHDDISESCGSSDGSSTSQLDCCATTKSFFMHQIRGSNQMKVARVEVDEFFTKTEENYHKQVMNKYNFDFLNEKPMKGRYEWVRVDPPQ